MSAPTLPVHRTLPSGRAISDGGAATCTPEYRSNRIRRIAYGQWNPWVDSARTIAHLNDLRAMGMSAETIADLSGVSTGTLQGLLWPSPTKPARRSVRPATEAAVLAVRWDLDAVAAHRLVLICGTRRRLQALAVQNWTTVALADRLGLTKSAVQNWTSRPRLVRITAGRARDVRALYRELADVRVPGGEVWTSARYRALAKGWAPPAAWDDREIDYPSARPTG